MTMFKLIAIVADRDTGRTLAGAMQDLLDPPPDALSLFEAAPAGWRVEAYYRERPDPKAIQRELGALLGRPLPRLEPEDIPDLNWVALSQAALPPVRAGRYTVHGSHDKRRVPRGPHAIVIDAGEAFGTAHHATTRGCLAAIDRLTRQHTFRRVLDLGTGSGVLAIAASRALPRARVLATDIDRQSVGVARSNTRINSAARCVRVAQADGVDAPAVRSAAPFDLVIANILAGPLILLAGPIARISAAGGALVLSGLLTSQAAEVAARYVAAGFLLVAHDRLAGWSTLTLRRRRSGARPSRHQVLRPGLARNHVRRLRNSRGPIS